MPFYYLQKFRTGTRRLTIIAAEHYAINISATVIAGAGGTTNQGGGSGAGGMLEVTNEPLINGTTYSIQVGGGGAIQSGAPGTNSFFGETSIAQGGGPGNQGPIDSNGGSGGGSSVSGTAGTATQGSTTYGVGYGYYGGTGITSGWYVGGGGGGAGGNGSNSSGQYGGNGGNGRASSINSITYAGGGGGGSGNTPGTGGSGGSGGGGAGGRPGSGNSGAANTGSGGGGGADIGPYGGGAGGSGIVILKIPSDQYSGITTGTPAVDTTTAAGFVILTYTGNGSYTA